MGDNETKISVQERVLKVAREVLMLEHNSIDMLDVSFKNDLTLTSLEQLTLFIALEDEFDRNIPQDEVAHIDTIRAVIDYVEMNLGPTIS